LYIDVSDDAPWDLGSLAFRDKVTALAAPVHGIPKDQLAGDDLREQRRFRRLRAAAIAGLGLLTVLAVVAAGVAVVQRQQAVRRLHDAVAAKLNAQGAAMLAGLTPGGDERGLQELLAANAIEPSGVPILDAQIARFTTQKIIQTGSPVSGLAYSPDGHRVATGEGDGSVRQWDTSTGRAIGSPLKGHTETVTGVVYTPDGSTIASIGSDDTLRLWNAGTGAARSPKPQHIDNPASVAVSPSGTAVVTGAAADTTQLWDVHSGALLNTARVLNPPTGKISDVKFDGSGDWFAASFTGGVAIYDAKTFVRRDPTIQIKGMYAGAPSGIFQIALSPDGQTLAVGTDNLQFVKTATGEQLHAISLGTAKGGSFATAVAFSPDGRRVASGRIDGAVQVWDTETGAQIGPTLTGHTQKVTGIAFSADGRQLASTSLDGTLRLWSATVGQPMSGPDPILVQVAFSPDGRLVAASGANFVQQWEVGSGRPLPPLEPGDVAISAVRYLPDDKIITADRLGTIRIWQARTNQPVQPPVKLETPAAQHHFVFSGDGHAVAMSDDFNGIVRMWAIPSGHVVGHPMATRFHHDVIYGMALSADGHHLAVGYDDGIRVWNADTTELEKSFASVEGLLNPVAAVAFSHDGGTLAAARGDGTVELWDLATGKQLPTGPLHGQSGYALGLAFGTGHQMAGGGTDAAVRLWDTATGAPTAAALARSDTVTGVAVSPDGRLVASSDLSGQMVLSPAISDPAQLCDKLSTNMSHKHWRDWVSPGIDYIPVCPGLPIAPD
jgi:WD40 repeat protein